MDEMLRVAQAFAGLGDEEVVSQCLGIAERLAAECSDPSAVGRVREAAVRLKSQVLPRHGRGLQQQGETHHQTGVRVPDLPGRRNRAVSHPWRPTRAGNYPQILLRRPEMKGRVAWFVLAVAGALIGCAAGAQAITLQHSFNNPSPDSNDLFGQALSLSGGKALVGALLDGTTGSGSGQAYLFDTATGALLHTFANPTPAANDFFGLSVSLSGNRALIGAQNDDTGASNSGAAYVFDAITGGLVRTFLNPGPLPVGGDNFGHAVALFGDRALISATGDDVGASNAGAAYFFDTVTGALLRTFLNPTPASGDQFGSEVALFGDKALISAIFDDTGATNAGAAYLFDITTGALLRTFNNPTPARNDTFGFDIALSGTKALIGATQDDGNGFNEGAAYLFDLATGNLLHTLLIPSPNGDSEFLGEGIALSADRALVGAAFDNSQGPDRGAAYLFDANTGALLQEIFDPEPAINDRFGMALALDGHEALIGAQTDLSGTTRPGRVFYYADAVEVPGPGTLALMVSGLAGLFASTRRKATSPS